MKVLLIEDSPLHRDLIRSQLAATTDSIELEMKENLADGLERLSRGDIDAVLLDLILPDSAGIETLWRTLAHSPDIAIVVLTSLDDEELATQAIQRGAQDYLGKEQISGHVVARSLRHAVERKRLQTRMERYAEALERNTQDLRQFTAIATERLRSPIRVTEKTFEHLLERHGDALDDESKARIDVAMEGLNYLRRLLDDFRTYTSVGTVDRGEGPPARVDVETVLTDVRASLKDEIEACGLEWSHDALPTVSATRDDVYRVLHALLDNAIKHRRDESLAVHLSARRDGREWIFSMRDNGSGIDPDYPGQIFVAFEKLGEGEGSGVGLAISKRIVEGYGGRIWVESTPGVGSVFFFTLPVGDDRDAGEQA